MEQGLKPFNRASHGLKKRRKSSAPTGKIHVLFVITTLAMPGGATNVVLNLADYFDKHSSYDVEILTGPVPTDRVDMTPVVMQKGLKIQTVRNLINQINPVANARAVAEIWYILIKGNYDIVHTHSSVAGVVGRWAAFLARTPVIIHHVHGWGLQEGMSRFTRTLYLTLERLTAKITTRLITVCRTDIYKGLTFGIAKENCFTLIYNGIDLKKFREPIDASQIFAELGLDATCKTIGMVGRLVEQKNPLDFIRAAALVVKSYPKVQFVMIGDGPLYNECANLVEQLALREKFKFLGFRNDVSIILPVLTLTAMSSLWEGLPIAFIESMSAGKPIVANDVDGVSDVIIDGETGFLVPPHQPQKMADRIICLLNDESLCEAMGQAAQQHSDSFSLQNMMEQVESLYWELYNAAQVD